MNSSREEVEQRILGGILYRPDYFKQCLNALQPEWFITPLHRKAIEAMFDCHDNNIEISLNNIWLHKGFEGWELAELDDYTIRYGGGDLPLLTKMLAEQLMLDKLSRFAKGVGEEQSPFTLWDDLHRLDIDLAGIFHTHFSKSQQELQREYAAYLKSKGDTGLLRTLTPFPTLNEMLNGGLEPGGFTLIGGAPGAGKTSFMLSLALHASRAGAKTTFIEGEMPANEIYERLNGIATGNSIDVIRKGKNYTEVTEQFMEELKTLPLDVVVCEERTLERLCDEIRRAIHSGSVIIFCDYLQVFTSNDMRDEFQEIKKVSQTLRALSLKHNIHLCVASSLNRMEAKEAKYSLHSFYGSSGLGHDCTRAFILNGKQDDTAELHTGKRSVLLNVVKNRNGARGEVELVYDLGSQRMCESVSSLVGLFVR